MHSRVLPQIFILMLVLLLAAAFSGCEATPAAASASSGSSSSKAVRASSGTTSSSQSASSADSGAVSKWTGLTTAQEDANADAGAYTDLSVGSLQGIPVICYHDLMLPAAKGNVSNTLVMTTDKFDREMAILKGAGYVTIGMEDLKKYIANGGDASRKVMITFDDGYKQSCLLAAPILRKYGFQATMFVIARYLDEPEQACDYSNFAIQYVSKKDLAETSDVFTFASHTYNMHIDLRTQSNLTKLRDDLLHSRSVLQETPYFAYPAGNFNAGVEQQLQQAGFTMAFTTKRKYVQPGIGLFEIPRFELYSNISDAGFKGVLGITKKQ
jgi:peptidoglycan/xylan/chitin deacetylase (PgdA/CDA1 family)